MNDLFDFIVLCFIAVAIGVVTYFVNAYELTQPDNFDSMLCRVHTPTADILVNDEMITCINGKEYRATKQHEE